MIKSFIAPILSLLLAAVLFLFSPFCGNAQHRPGGVPGAEIWYVSDSQDIFNDIFPDRSDYPLLIERCPNHQEPITSGLLNFNHAISTEELCLQFRAPLEALYSKSIFIVAEPGGSDASYPMINSEVTESYVHSVNGLYSENAFVIETQEGFAAKTDVEFNSYENAHVYYYNWNHFDQEKKYKSYGQEGEAKYILGSSFSTGSNDAEKYFFAGILPEFITFNRKLSKNEFQRIESYLALKYGITKWDADSYKDSENRSFWDKENNLLFSNNIYGIGRDDISGLNQLQSESVHNKGYLITAVDSIMNTNEEVQNQTAIPDKHFLVFGNSGGSGTVNMNSPNFERLNKVWLAQSSGDTMKQKSLEFKLNIEETFNDETIENILREKAFVWMLHDLRANRDEVSDFENNNVHFYRASSVSTDSINGMLYAHFRQDDLKFDTDGSSFDQFTFAVGAECTLQFQPVYSCELAKQGVLNCYDLSIILIGDCQSVELYDSNDQQVTLTLDPDLSELNENPTYIAEICAPEYYSAKLFFSDGSTETYNYEALPIGPFQVDLGNAIQYLPGNTGIITLDAGHSMPPGSTFKWFLNNEELYHFEPVLIVSETGYYCVEATSPDGLCTVIECVTIDSQLDVIVECISGSCMENSNSIKLTFVEGFPPFNIEIEPDNGIPLQFYSNAESFTVPDLADEFHFIRVTDAENKVFEGFCDFQPASGGNIVIIDDEKILSSTNPEYIIDAAFLTNDLPTALFEWFLNGEPMAHSSPSIVATEPGTYSVIVRSMRNECYTVGKQEIGTTLEGEIYQLEPCSIDETFVFIDIEFGFPPFITEIIGINGTTYSEPPIFHNGSINRDIPLGSYRITTTDDYGNSLEEELIFETVMMASLEEQISSYCTTHSCNRSENFCNLGFTHYNFYGTTLHQMSLSAMVTANPNLFDYNWYLDGMLISTDQHILLVKCSDISPKCEYSTLKLSVSSTSPEYEDCDFTEVVYMDPNWCFATVIPEGYTSKVFPNPTDADVTFNYLIRSNAEKIFKGKIEVFSSIGALIFSDQISGAWEYSFTYRLMSSGVYLIRTTTEEGVIKVDRVIIK